MVRRFPVIVGPTAGGKTDLAVETALEFARRGLGSGEVVSADSMMIYRGLDIGSAKPTEAERRGVPHHLIDIIDPGEGYTVHQWLRDAERAIAAIQARGNTPIVAGGTHFYIKAFLEGLFEGPGADTAIREELGAMDPRTRRAMLEEVDPPAAARIHPNDTRRTIRALEVFRLTGIPLSQHQQQWGTGPRQDCLLVGLEWPVETLNRRINARVKRMVEIGLVEEARRLWSEGRFGPQSCEALGYKQLIAHFEGRVGLEEAIEEIKIETRRFAKNQRTWLKRLKTVPGSLWFDCDGRRPEDMAQTVVNACLADGPEPP